MYRFLKFNLFILIVICVGKAMWMPETARAETVRIAIGRALPPYAIPEQDAGIEIDIIRQALRIAGHTAKFLYLPNLRIPHFMKEHLADAAATNATYDLQKDTRFRIFPSDTTITYRNYAISLARNHFHITRIDDLIHRSVIAFQNATNYLGPDFARMAKTNPRYMERADQCVQVHLILKGRIDVAVSDKRIFLYWKNQAMKTGIVQAFEAAQPLVFYPIFPEALRHCAFTKARLRDDFNNGLEQLKKNGNYYQIRIKYKNM